MRVILTNFSLESNVLRWPTPQALHSFDIHTRVQENDELRLRQQMAQLSAAVATSPSAVLVTSTQTLPSPSVNTQLMAGKYQGVPASVYPPVPAAVYQSAAIIHPSEVMGGASSVELANNNQPRRAGACDGAQVLRADSSVLHARPRQAVTRESPSTARAAYRP